MNNEIFGVGVNATNQFDLNPAQSPITVLAELPLSSSGIKSFSCGNNHAIYLKHDNRVLSVGKNTLGQCGQVGTSNRAILNYMKYINILGNIKEFTKAIAVACGSEHCLVLDDNGDVWVCGQGSFGKLGTGNTSNQTSLVRTLVGKGIIRISAGESHSIAISSDGKAYGCGNNGFNQIGITTSGTNQLTWIEVSSGLPYVLDGCAGSWNSLLLTNEGVYSCGIGTNGALGNGTFDFSSNFTLVSGLTDMTINKCVGGDEFFMILNKRGVIYSWGNGLNGRTGLNTTDNVNIPTVTDDERTFIDIGANRQNGYGIEELTNLIICWGNGDDGCLGFGSDLSDILFPTVMPSGENFSTIMVNSPRSTQALFQKETK